MQNFFFVTQNLLSREVSRYAALFILAASMVALSGCGSGQALPQEFPVVASTTGPATASIQLLASSTTIASSGVETVDLTAVVLDASKQTISGKTVKFSTGSDTSAFVNNISTGGVSDANGLVTGKLNLGSNKGIRDIIVTATADSAAISNSISVTGTTVTVSGNSSLTSGNTTTLTFSVKDSAKSALSGVTLNFSSKNGNTIAPITGVTDSTGQITAVITASVAGDDVITATGAGISATQVLTISPDNFAFTTPAANTDIPLGTAPTVTVNWKSNGVAVVGSAVSFSGSRGLVAGSPATTNASGDASITISSGTTAGPSIITASGLSGNKPAATLNVTFVATTATSVTVQAVPGVVAFTTGAASQTNNSSTISVVVRDGSSNLVKNASVNFTITADPSAGKLTSSSVVTDVSGSASVAYVAGTTSSPSNGVKISAAVTAVNGVNLAVPITNTTSLTVAGQANLVSLGTDNLVGGTAPTNTKTYIAIVTDTAGNRVAGATVAFSLRPGRFRKGTYVLATSSPPPAAADHWAQVIEATCPNEDLLFDGIVDAGEDLNGNGKLDPGGAATVNATGVSDANGIATATIAYAKDHSTWAEMTLEARTGVAGNDPPTTVTFFLPGLAADYTDISIFPPGRTSPYGAGVSTLCTDTN